VITELLDNTIVARGEYGRILQQYLDYFPRSQLLVVFTEEFERDPQTTLDKILAHVGLPTGYTPPNLGKKYHRGGTKQRLPWLIPAARRLAPLRFLWKLLSRRRRRVIYTWYRRELNVVVEENDSVPPATREQLVAFYRPDMRRLAAIAERSLPWPEFESQG
jgi:hypothetical protein